MAEDSRDEAGDREVREQLLREQLLREIDEARARIAELERQFAGARDPCEGAATGGTDAAARSKLRLVWPRRPPVRVGGWRGPAGGRPAA